MRMKVLFVIDHLRSGGAQNSVKNIVENLPVDEIEPFVCALRPASPEVRIDAEVLTLNYHKYNPCSFIRIARFCKEHDIDIMHSQLGKSNLVCLAASFLCKRPVIVHERGDIFLKGTTHSIYRFLFRMLGRRAALVIANSKTTASHLVSKGRLDESLVRVIYNAIDFDIFDVNKISRSESRRKLGISDDTFVVGFAGRLHPIKGPDLVVKSVPSVLAKFPKLLLLLAGDGPQRKNLEALTEQLGIAGRVRFLGTRNDIADVMAAFDLAVVSSRQESFGRAVVEFMRIKVPVITSGADGLGELVSDGDTGLVTAENTPEEISRCILKLAGDEELRRQLVDNAYAFSDQFSSIELVDKLMKVYREVLESSKQEKTGCIMKISILCSDLSSNCLGRAHLLGKILQRQYEVEIVGPVFGDGIWEPLADHKDIDYKPIKIGRFPASIVQLSKLFAGKIDGDIIYVSKPSIASLLPGLFQKLFKRKPLILDIDDWERGFIREKYKDVSLFRSSSAKQLKTAMRKYAVNTSSFLGEKLSRFADHITVSNTFLQNRFGGTLIWHARDTDIFNPALFDKYSLRKSYKIDQSKKIVLFFGTPRPHKGIEDLVHAVSLIDDPNLTLAIVGTNEKDSFSKTLTSQALQRLGDRLLTFGFQPFEKVPEFLAMADIAVIPQRRNLASAGQLPAKIFDAMAMAKPIIATAVSDMPDILDGCGWIIEPEKPELLAETIQYILDNPQQANETGQRARQKCIEKYSFDAMGKRLSVIFEKYISGR